MILAAAQTPKELGITIRLPIPFVGKVKTVETRDFWRDKTVSPSGAGYHYNRNAETYMLVGHALGRGMVELQEGK